VKLEKPDIYGIVGSAFFCGIVLLLLLLIYLPGRAAEEAGIMISFGEVAEGGGNQPYANEPNTPNQPPPPPSSQPTVHEYAMTQDYEESLRIEEKKRKEREQQQLEEQRKNEQRRLAEEQKRRDEQARQDKINQANNDIAGAFGNSGGSGSGHSQGDTRQGNPLGQGTSNGNSWSLGGRSLNGTLPVPNDNQKVEGRITVSIRVDKTGKVTQATIGTPTNISDPITQKAAIEAARRTSFSAGNNEAEGSITYNIKLR
jgi:TonB family protein